MKHRLFNLAAGASTIGLIAVMVVWVAGISGSSELNWVGGADGRTGVRCQIQFWTSGGMLVVNGDYGTVDDLPDRPWTFDLRRGEAASWPHVYSEGALLHRAGFVWHVPRSSDGFKFLQIGTGLWVPMAMFAVVPGWWLLLAWRRYCIRCNQRGASPVRRPRSWATTCLSVMCGGLRGDEGTKSVGHRLFNLAAAALVVGFVASAAVWAAGARGTSRVSWTPLANPLIGNNRHYAMVAESSSGLLMAHLSCLMYDADGRVADQRGWSYEHSDGLTGWVYEQGFLSRAGFHWRRDHQPSAEYLQLGLPLWAPMAVLAVVPGCWISMAWRRYARRVQRVGCCPKCGYDLRGSPAGGACPECGVVRPAPTESKA